MGHLVLIEWCGTIRRISELSRASDTLWWILEKEHENENEDSNIEFKPWNRRFVTRDEDRDGMQLMNSGKFRSMPGDGSSMVNVITVR